MATETSAILSKGEQTRQSILEAAVNRFANDGYRATSVADIARDAGVGGTVTYAYFANKEALFLAAVDEDAAGVILEGVSSVLDSPRTNPDWRLDLFSTLLGAVNRHPLAHRLLAGLEPDVTDRVYEIPALQELRKVVIERMRAEQATGMVRTDIDIGAVANGAVTLIIALLIAAVQLGPSGLANHGADIAAVFQAAIEVPGSALRD